MMKKVYILFCFIVFCITVYAAPVSKERAQAVAQAFFETKSAKTTATLAPRRILSAGETAQNADGEYFYVFSGTEGDVIVAADDCARPILGYTDRPLPADRDLPENFKSWLKGYERQIEYARQNALEPSAETIAEWNRLSTTKANPKIVIAPLLTTVWDQLEPYNKFTPAATPTGCVATAMAQVMRYWQFPDQGAGSRAYKSTSGRVSANFENTKYDWANMPSFINEYSPTEQINAVATLIYHCGVASSMEYGEESSGTYLIENYSRRGDDCAEYALKTYFGYKTTMHGELRDYKTNSTAYTDAEWTQMVKDELEAGRPLLYSGYGNEGGHAFVCDGYRDDDSFHFNWGWSGYADGYFYLDALILSGVGTGGGDGHFNYLQQALFGLEPDRIENLTKGRYDLQLSQPIALPDEKIEFSRLQDVSLSVQIINCGELDFSGLLYIVMTDGKGNIIDTIYNMSVQVASANRKIISVDYTPDLMLTPGIYTFTLYYRDAALRGGVVGETQLEIYYNSTGINAVSNFVIGDEGLRSGQNASVGITIKNIDQSAFRGQARIVLVTPAFDDIPQILTTENISQLEAGGTMQLTFNGMINVPVGVYILALQYYAGNSWNLAGSEEYFNPVWVNVESAVTSLTDIKSSVSIYPNPATDYINIMHDYNGAAAITLSDLSGHMILSVPAIGGNTTVDVTKVPTGLYILTYTTATSTDVYKVVIK